MVAGGRLGDAQARGDLAVAEALADECHDLPLASCQSGCIRCDRASSTEAGRLVAGECIGDCLLERHARSLVPRAFRRRDTEAATRRSEGLLKIRPDGPDAQLLPECFDHPGQPHRRAPLTLRRGKIDEAVQRPLDPLPASHLVLDGQPFRQERPGGVVLASIGQQVGERTGCHSK